MNPPPTAIPLPLPQLEEFCLRWAVERLEVFGSVLRPEDFGPESDVDFLVTWKPEAHVGLAELEGMEQELRRLTGRRVDLVPRRAVETSQNWLRRRYILEKTVTLVTS